MSGEIDLNEEYQTKHDTYFILPCQVGLAKQHARSWGNDDRRHELPKIEGSRKQGHHRGSRVFATLDTRYRIQVRFRYFCISRSVMYSPTCLRPIPPRIGRMPLGGWPPCIWGRMPPLIGADVLAYDESSHVGTEVEHHVGSALG